MRHKQKKTDIEQRAQANQRALERFGATPDKSFYEELEQKIRSKDRPMTGGTCSNTFSLWWTKLNDKPAVAVYDKKRHVICSFLTEEVWRSVWQAGGKDFPDHF